MTRGQIVLFTEGKVLSSIEFNGDMYPPANDGWVGYGQDVIDGLKMVGSVQEYEDFVRKFNADHHDYKDVKQFVYDALAIYNKDYNKNVTEECLLDMQDGYFDKWFSDYLYFKNIRDEEVTVYDDEGKAVIVKPQGILVLNFGSFTEECAKFSSGVSVLVKLRQRYIDICEDHGWSVREYPEQDYVELEQSSPAGEDVVFDVSISKFVDDIKTYACNFDPDEHAEGWIECRGQRGTPSSIRALIDDADAIQEMLEELAQALAQVASR